MNEKNIYCEVKTTSHNLLKRQLDFLTSANLGTRIVDVEKNRFKLSCKYNSSIHSGKNHFIMSSDLIFATYIMALNVATLGFFYFDSLSSVSPIYHIDDHIEQTKEIITINKYEKKLEGNEELTSQDERKVSLLFGVLIKESEDKVVQEYLKGIIHLSLNFGNIDFKKDAFVNFYRAMENTITEKVLNKKGLKNEKIEIKKAMESLGLGGKLADEFDELYKIRGSQIMHAQNIQLPVTLDDVLKMKVILDAILQKYYKPIWTERMQNLNGV
jgi:hypothetical protein